MKTLSIGDTVLWKGSWGSLPEQKAEVVGIEMVHSGHKYGVPVDSVDWSSVDDRIVVSLNNNQWAFGSQISCLSR